MWLIFKNNNLVVGRYVKFKLKYILFIYSNFKYKQYILKGWLRKAIKNKLFFFIRPPLYYKL